MVVVCLLLQARMEAFQVAIKHQRTKLIGMLDVSELQNLVHLNVRFQSETPAEVSFSKGVFGAGTGESVDQPTSSLCKSEEQI